MASPQNQSGNGTRYTLIYSDATSTPTDAAGGLTFNVSNPVPAGLIEQVGFRLTGTTAAPLSAASAAEIVSGLRFTLNGDQVINLQTQGNVNTSANCSRMGAIVQDIGGFVAENPSLTDIDMTIWVPLGINAPVNSRFELTLDYVAAAATPTSCNFELWIKYGKSTNMTIIGNQTSMNIADNAQTMVSVKIPTIKGATVAGIVVQGSAVADNMVSVIPKILGDFALSPTQVRAASGVNANGYQFADVGDSDQEMQYSNAVRGLYFIPLYNAAVSDGSVVLLLTSTTAGAPGNEFYTFTPILNLPTSGSGERTPRQTAQVATGSKGAILSRAEDI
jgi:hypothetical protein